MTRAAEDGNPPPRKSVVASNEINTEGYRELFPRISESLEKARPRPRTVHWRQIEKCLAGELQKLINGALDVAGFVAGTNTKLDFRECR
jgi:hypothetical protein